MLIINILYNIIIYPLVQIFEFIFVFFQKVFKETGISILGISVAISLLTLPLYMIAEKWQIIERETQKKLKPAIDKIKAVFKGDEQYMILNTYYKQNHYHPIYAMRSTFGLLIQIPFFIAAYSFLKELEALKGASFFLISDLSRPDSILLINNITFNVLPIVMTIINCSAAALYTKGFKLREKLQLYIIALIFLILLYNASSALVIYWTMNNLFSLLRNFYINIRFKQKKIIPAIAISLAGLFTLYYIIFIHNGSLQQRMIIALLSALLAIIPWIFVIIKPVFNIPTKQENNHFILFVLSVLLLWLLIGLYIPSNLIVSSPDEFSFIDSYANPLFFISNTSFQAFGLLFFWPFCLYLLFSNKIKKIFSLIIFILATGAICNAFMFPGNYGFISVSMQFSNTVEDSKQIILSNIFSLLFLSVIAYLIYYWLNKLKIFIIPIISICAAVLLVISITNIISIQKSFKRLNNIHNVSYQEVTDIKPIFQLSRKGKNTVIIMLDRASSSFFPYILEEDPLLKNKYSGFIYFPNTVSFHGYTSVGAPPLFGGYEYTPQEMNLRDKVTLLKKHNESLLLLPTIFSKAGFHVTVTDPPYPNFSASEDLSIYESLPNVNAVITDSIYTNIWARENNFNLPTASDILKRDILWYSIFKSIPPVFRWSIYQRGDWCSSISGQKVIGLLNGYSVIDYLPRLMEINENKINTALIMTNNSTHEGAFLQAPDYRPSLNVVSYGTSPFAKETEYHINIAAFKRLADWFEYLRKEDIYDNTRIILVSDHGSQISYVNKAKPGFPDNFDNLHPILLYKDFASKGTLKIDNTFMSNADVPFLALNGQINNPTNPFTGNKITMDAKKKPLYIGNSGIINRLYPSRTKVYLDPKRDYYIHENIFDPNNWEKVEN